MPSRVLILSSLAMASAAGPFAAFGTAVCKRIFIDHLDCASYTTDPSAAGPESVYEFILEHANRYDGGDVARTDLAMCTKVSETISETLSGADYDNMMNDATAATQFCDEYFTPEYHLTHAADAYGKVKR